MKELNVKIGDDVLVSNGNRYEKDVNDFIAKVEKITPTGRIRIFGKIFSQFDKYGWEMGAKKNIPYRLFIPTEEDYKRIEKNKLVKKIIYNIKYLDTENLYNLDKDTLQLLKTTLDCVGISEDKLMVDKR